MMKNHSSQNKNVRIPKSFDERCRELIGALEILHNSLVMFQKTNGLHWLREMAIQLRALLISAEGSKSLIHPLLVELADEKNYPLTVYVSKFALLREIEQTHNKKMKPTFSYGENMLSLESESWRTKLTIEKDIKLPYIVMRKKKYSLERIIRLVADTEGSHYDPCRPEDLVNLGRAEIWGVSSAYHALLELGYIVYNLGIQFIQSTAKI